jgi:tetratricopeptide (TPR) repeat protein
MATGFQGESIWTSLHNSYKEMRKLHYLTLPALFLLSSCILFEGESYKQQADELRKSEEYDEAISAYKKHINHRLKVNPRPDWDNPYIYLLDIGDIYLEQGQVEKALKQYEEAEEKGVKQAYCNDRYRAVALYYEERGELKKSLKILEKYREKDTFLIDLMLDRLARKLIAAEDSPQPKSNDPLPTQ